MQRLLNLKLAMVLLVCALVSGCFSWYDYNSANNYSSKRDMPRQDTSRAYQTAQQYGPVSHKVTNLTMNQFLSDQVAAMDGVNSAIVMMGDNTAYVAITIDNTATGTNGGTDPGTAANLYGYSNGQYNHYPRAMAQGDINQLSPSFVAETEKHHEHLTHLFKQKIAEKVRLLQPSVSDVYISANRTFVNAFNLMAIESWKGASLEPFRPQFIDIVERTFGVDPTIPNQAEGNGREY